METLGDLFTLLRTYTKAVARSYAYLKIYDDLSGGLYCYDDVEMFLFDSIPEGCKILAGLIAEATK